jgi:C4-dicarboxylate-specific signal transduction histidine kinase
MILRARTSLRRLKLPEPDVQEAMKDMERITADGNRAAEIINSVRANFRQDQRARTSIDLNRLVTETASLLHADLRRQSIRLRLTLDPHLARVTGNPTQLQQVLLNLLSNAAESTAGTPGPRILTVRTQIRETADSRKVSISVADMGSGVSPEHLERIFAALYTTKPEGMGMGLAICRSIIEAHGGRIWAAPNHPKGAILEFTLEAEAIA